MSREQVSAGFLRSLGVSIPGNIPDCATAKVAKVTPVFSISPAKDTLPFEFTIELGPFTWVEIKQEITE
jgi:hypothetical protein